MEGKVIEIEGVEYNLNFNNRKVNLYKIPSSKQIVKIKTIESTDYTLNNKYLLLPILNDIYCFFFNINNQSPGGPNPSSHFTQIEVFLDSPNKTANQIAQSIKDKIDSILSDKFEVSITNDELIITNKQPGSTLYNYLPRDANTNFTITIEQYGRDENSLIKSNFPEQEGGVYGFKLYDILDVDLELIYDDEELIGGDLLISGIYENYENSLDKRNNVVSSSEFESTNTRYSNWLLKGDLK